MKRFEKIIIITIAKVIITKNSILNLWEDSKYVPSFKYVRVLNIREFS